MTKFTATLLILLSLHAYCFWFLVVCQGCIFPFYFSSDEVIGRHRTDADADAEAGSGHFFTSNDANLTSPEVNTLNSSSLNLPPSTEPLYQDNKNTSSAESLFDPNFCNGAVSPALLHAGNSTSSRQLRATYNSSLVTSKYVVFYPRAGMGNVIAGYTSAAMYACLTGREIKIAPRSERETDVFQCEEYFASGPGSICHDLEMSNDLVQRYRASRTAKRSPEAWSPSHCRRNKIHFDYFLCDEGTSSDEFVAINSCQYYGDLFHFNPHFKDRLSNNPYRDLVRGRLKPSDKVRSKMVKSKAENNLCIHIRSDLKTTNSNLGEDWVRNLEKCVRNIYSTNDNDLNKDILLFTMHQDVRETLKKTLEKGPETLSVRYASEVTAKGTAGHSSDPYQGVADMFSMATKCVTILPSNAASKYLLMSANLMNNTRVFPGDRWEEDACMQGTEIFELKPHGDYWNGNDVCNIRDTQCLVGNQAF